MTQQTVATTMPSEDHRTRAGNYFVSNYPPFSHWTPDEVPEVFEALQKQPAGSAPLGLYIHIPFCRKRCHFCYFRVYTDKNARQIKTYLDACIAELERYAATPFLGGRRPLFIYFGGGTPSYLSAKQLQELTDGMKSLMSWDDVEEVTFECEPGTLSERKLESIRAFGTTRLSLGVENFDDRVLQTNGRAHLSKEIMRAYEYARSLDFPQINIDLIAGMLNETPENWRQCVERTLELSPDSVTVYQMEIPFNTTIYRNMRESGKLVAPIADWDTKRDWVNIAFSRLEEAGYTVTSGYTAVKNPEKTRFVYRDRLWTGADLLSLGVASFGHLTGHHYQNLTQFEEYLDAIAEGRFPFTRALTTTPDERMIRELILQMKLGRVSRSYFDEKFNVDIMKRFSSQWSHLRADGLAEVDEHEVHLRRQGLLIVDSLLPDFFLPQHQAQRHA